MFGIGDFHDRIRVICSTQPIDFISHTKKVVKLPKLYFATSVLWGGGGGNFQLEQTAKTVSFQFNSILYFISHWALQVYRFMLSSI